MKTEFRNRLLLTLLMVFTTVSTTAVLPGFVDARECSGSKANCSSAADCVSPETCDAVMRDYCIVPPFIQESIKPNMLMIIDNSASMYDLAYDDKGYKRCSTSSLSCSVNSDCSSTETCNQVRNPTYCYDQTFNSANSYVGYFDNTKNYRYNFSTSRFEVVVSIPASCVMAAVDDQVYCKLISNTLHVNIDKTNPVQTKYFYASGNYLNWLTASKFDVEKEVLTGGKYVTKVCSHKPDKSCILDADCNSATETGNTCVATSAFLQPESRGCVGMGYVKDANVADFTNFVTGVTDPNTDLGLTFLVKGPSNPFNPVSPSTGGQTYLEIYSKTGVPYDNEACEKAIVSIATGTNADIKQDVDSCLASSGAASGYCSQNSSLTCIASYGPLTPNCDKPVVSPNPHCSTASSRSCTVANEAADCTITGASTCTTGRVGVVCTDNTQCDVKTCALNSAKSCSVNAECVNATETMGTCNKKQQTACRTDNNCISGGGNIDNGPCDGYIPAYNYGACVVSTAGTCTAFGDVYTGPCVSTPSGYLGPCVFTPNEVETRTKISFSQSMQACWSLRNGTAIGVDDINTVINQCSDIYGSYKTCSNNAFQLCSGTVAGECGAGTCLDGPAAIQSGNPALMCSINYEGQYFEKNASNAWVLKPGYSKTSPELLATHTAFCNAMDTPVVTDPTNPPSTSTTTENLPAILSGIGVEAQLGSPIATLPVRVETADLPDGLVQEYANKIRIGLMSFNSYGSTSETSTTIPLPAGKLKPTKVCSNDATMVCIQSIDCGPGNTCAAATDYDGAAVIALIGKGSCLTSAGTGSGADCTKQAHCTTTGETCVSDGVGDHTTGLVRSVDNLRAATWTPFAEAFYNAIGYFAMDPTDSTGKKSRYSALRLNADDYPNAMNPSEYVCQSNNILLVTDGSSTADQSSAKTTLVNAYKSLSGNVTGTCPKYAGSQDMDDLVWLAYHKDINTFDPTTSTGSTAPDKNNESITSYIVFNGADNGETGDCNNMEMLQKSATNGGTEFLTAEDPAQYKEKIGKVFAEIAGGSASGTAASILNNSEGSGAILLQAIFFPIREYEDKKPITWSGELLNLWYYVDPFFTLSTIREDSDYISGNTHTMDIDKDKRVQFYFDSVDNQTKVRRYNSGGTTTAADMNSDLTSGLKTIWTAGKKLWKRNILTTGTDPDPRTIYTTVDSEVLKSFNLANAADLSSSLAAEGADAAAKTAFAQKVIRYVHGEDVCLNSSAEFSSSAACTSKSRNRTVKITVDDKGTTDKADDLYGTHVWKLGDIISSTPKLQGGLPLQSYDQKPPLGYSDDKYKAYYSSDNYKNRGMVYVGANDGMLHAFRMGKINIRTSGSEKATLKGVNLGREEWAFIPKHVLPYLKYLTLPEYDTNHLYLVDGANLLFDVATGISAARDDYWNETRTKDTWKTVLLGGMGLGGASKNIDAACSAGTDGGTCVKTPVAAQGFSSYFALDVTNQDYTAETSTSVRQQPTLLWEFSHPDLGYATSGPALVRIEPKPAVASDEKNGRWFAVYASGPTGPIETDKKQFKGKSDQNLKLFVVDIEKGPVVNADPKQNGLWVIDTGITEAFAGTISNNSVVDAETIQTFPLSVNDRQDDVIYIGYTKKAGDGTWTDGGVLRLVIPDSADPDVMDISQWQTSRVVSGIGPVTTAVSKLMSKNNLYLFFGTGRFYYPQDDMTPAVSRKIFMVKENCYPKKSVDGVFASSDIIDGCNETSVPPLTLSNLENRNTASNDPIPAGKSGWYIDLDTGERIVTDTVSTTSGTIFYTSFKPNADPCALGGKSYLWGVRYDTGGTIPAGAKNGKVLIQLSTGAFAEIDLKDALTEKGGRRTAETSDLSFGKASADAGLFMTSAGLAPVKKVLHIQERYK